MVAPSQPFSPSTVRTAGRSGRLALAIALAAMVLHLGMEVVLILARDRVPRLVAHDAAAVGLSVIAAVAACLALRSVLRDQRAILALVTQVQESEQRFSGIVSIAADAIITIDEDQAIVLFNDGAEAIFGWPAAEVIGRPLSVLLPASTRDAHTRHVRRFGEGAVAARRMGERQEIAGVRRDGTEFPAEASISRLEIAGRRLYTVVLRDITERRRQLLNERFLAGAGQTLSASLDYESTLVGAAHVAIPHLADCCILDLARDHGTTRRIASVHDDPGVTRALRGLGHRREPASDWPVPVATVLATGMPIRREDLPRDWAFVNAPDRARAEAVAALGVTGYLCVPLVARGNATGVLTLLATGAGRPLAPDATVVESVAKLIALAIDNAELYRTAQRATVARDEVLGMVSHDLRNPLAAIAMCARVLEAETRESGGDRIELLGAIIQSTEMMNHLIQDLLDVSMIDAGHMRVDPQPQPIAPLVNRALEMMSAAASERRVLLRSVVPAAFPPLHVDATRFVQVLSNLLGNAVKFSEAGASVTLLAELRDGEARVSVVDAGPGIPAADLPHLFDRHWQAGRPNRTGGTGLGLAIARGIVEAHGGRLGVESTVGRGSTFWFTMPVMAVAVPPPSRAPSTTTNP